MIKTSLLGESVKDGLKAKAKDRIYNFLLADGVVRGAFIQGTRMVNEMRANFELGILETLALGHAYLGCCLMSSNLKGNDRISMEIVCSGPLKGLYVETNTYGEVRGHLKKVPIPIEAPLESLSLSPFFGDGILKIAKYLEDSKQPYTGTISLKYGSIAKDLANYFYTSEQVPTVFNLSIKFDKKGQVIGAGGLFLQIMPGASDEIAEELENIIKELPSLGALMADNKNPEELIFESFKAQNPKFLDNYRIEFFCRCNPGLISGYISMLPKSELADIAHTGPFPLEVRCHNCNTLYSFTELDIRKLYQQRVS